MKTFNFSNEYFNIKDTLDSGQIFRYKPFKDGFLVFSVDKVCYVYEKDNKAVVVFRNKGEHLTKEKTDKLFDRFYRVDESRNTSTGGSGLGLAISKNIVELHGGRIWADSVGNNISFYVELDMDL